MHHRRLKTLAAALAFVAAASTARGLINPKFTPIDLVNNADLILLLKVRPGAKKLVLATRVLRSLKGKAPKKAPVIDLSFATQKEWAKAVAKAVAQSGSLTALLFVGKDEGKEEAAFLQVAGNWLRLEAGKGGTWEMIVTDTKMLGTWDGSAEMLTRVVDYVIKDEDPRVPIVEGCRWEKRHTIAKLSGKVHEARAIDLAGDGKLSLFIAAEKGDRLFRYDAAKKTFADRTAAHNLKSRSVRTAWADFNRDGRLDLASWDGKALRLWLQGAGGKFPVQGRRVAIGAPDCVGLSALDVGAAGRPGLLVSTSGSPVLLRPGRGGAFKATGLLKGAMTVKNFAAAGRCLVADFDGDGFVDVLQPFATRGLIYRGTGPGTFAAQRACSVALGTGRSAALIGDYDHDGRFDVTCVAEDGCRLWHNRGGLNFLESVRMAGEIRYTAQPGAIAGVTCDINNDGRQDLMLVYAAQIVQLFFNRGFFNLGKALDLIWKDPVFGESEDGQWAGTVADLNGDGAQDMALVLRNGRVRVYIREVFEDEPPLAVRAALPLGGPFAGPLRVTGWAGTRCLGAWNVVPGTREAFFGTQEPGELTLRWKFPGAKEQTRKVVLEDKSVRLLLAPK